MNEKMTSKSDNMVGPETPSENGRSDENKSEGTLIDELQFISQDDTSKRNERENSATKDGSQMIAPVSVHKQYASDRIDGVEMSVQLADDANLSKIGDDDESIGNLATELAFISSEAPDDPTKEATLNNLQSNKREQDTVDVVDELNFISQTPIIDGKVVKNASVQDNGGSPNDSPKSEESSTTAKIDSLKTNSKSSSTEKGTENLAGELAFITNEPKQEDKEPIEIKTYHGKRKPEALVDELTFISQNEKKEDKRRKKVRSEKLQNLKFFETKQSDSDGAADASSECESSSSPIKHIIAVVIFAIVAVLMTFANLRVGLNAFCPYDNERNTFIVMEKVEVCPVPVPQNDDQSCEMFWKKQEEEDKEDLFNYIPAPASKRHEIICRGAFNVLHAVAALLHPQIDYKTVMPQVHIHSPCPEIPKQKKQQKCGPVKKLVNKIAGILRKKKRDQKHEEIENGSTKNEDATKGEKDEFDWTLLVSVSLEMELSPKQLELAEKVSVNLKERLRNQDPDFLNQTFTFEEKFEQVKFGGTHPWWFPENQENDEISGLRLINAYMKIMDWPEDLVSYFPASGICSNGCPADFAISNTLNFREKYQPWKISPAVFEENRLGWVYVRGYSPTRHHPDPSVGGASILWLSPGLFKMQNAEPYSRALLHSLDTCVADAFTRSGGRMGKCNVVLDCKDVGLSKIPPIGPTKTLLKMMQDNYPDKLGVFVIANVSGAAQMFLKVLLPLLPQVVRQKIHIIPNDDEKRAFMLKELVHEDYIPIRLGGNDDYKFDGEAYYKAGPYANEFLTEEEAVEYHNTLPYYAP